MSGWIFNKTVRMIDIIRYNNRMRVMKSSYPWQARVKMLLSGSVLILGIAAVAVLQSRVSAYGPEAFVMVVKTDNAGTSSDNQFTIPTTGSGYNYSVDCNDDGTPEATGVTGTYMCTYALAGTYTVAITGVFPRINFNGTGDAQKVLEVQQWGDIQWQSMSNAFNGTTNLNVTATGTPDLSQVTNTDRMFLSSGLSGNSSFSSWDTSNVVSMDWMFAYTPAFNQPIESWDISNVVSIGSMFFGATAFNQPLVGWDTSNVTNMSSTFRSTTVFNQPLAGWDTSNVTGMNNMFRDTTAFNQPLDSWDTSSVTNIGAMFNNAAAFNQPLSSWDTSSVTNMSNTFNNAAAFNQNLGNWDVSSLTNAQWMLLSPSLSMQNYDSTLIGWLATGVNTGVPLNASAQYCAAHSQRQALITTYGWTINDGGSNCPPLEITITAPTKLNNASITDTTIRVTPGYAGLGLSPSDVSIDAATTAAASGFSCVQTTAEQVDCTVSVDSTGSLVIRAVNVTASASATATELDYIIDTIPPTSSVSIDVSGGVHAPVITFTTSDNIAVDYVEVLYTAPGGVASVISSATSPLSLTLDPDEAVHTIIVRTYDTAGNVSDNEISFPPIVTFTAPMTISDTTINSTTVTITTLPGNDVTNISLNPGVTGATLGVCEGASGETVGPYTQPVVCQIQGVSTTGMITISAEDASNGAIGSNNQSFTIETIAPTITITAPTKLADGNITDTTVTIVDDTAIDIDSVVITVTDATGSFVLSSSTACTQVHASQVSCSVVLEGEGTGTVHVSAIDVAGNGAVATEGGYEITLTTSGVTPPAPMPESSDPDNIRAPSTGMVRQATGVPAWLIAVCVAVVVAAGTVLLRRRAASRRYIEI